MTNAEFAKENPVFKRACLLAGLGERGNTKRQARKWRMGNGRAWQERARAQRALDEELLEAEERASGSR